MASALNFNGLLPAAARRDPIKAGPRVRLEIESHATGTAVPGWNKCLRRGKNEVVINSADLPAIEAKIEKRPEWIEEAKEIHRDQICVHVEKASKRKLGDDAKQALRAWAVTDPSDRDAMALAVLEPVQQSCARRYQGSWEAEFHNITARREGAARGRRPIKSYRVIEEMAPELSENALMVRDILGGMKPGGLDSETLGKAMAVAMAEMQKQEKRKGA